MSMCPWAVRLCGHGSYGYGVRGMGGYEYGMRAIGGWLWACAWGMGRL